ncbi:hypothetical protein DIPPA_05560 [Diplonema papillatum]|nr:hypothetical protein DIPPA_05560 [Diplonema papillatum]
MPTNEEVYQNLQSEQPELLVPHEEADCGLWELNATAACSNKDVSARLAQRQQQHKVVIELVNAKVKENYTRFVDGINKIQEVGTCSEQTTRTCDEGKIRLQMAKGSLVVKGLHIAQRQRRVANLKRVREIASRIRAIAEVHCLAEELIHQNLYAEAVLAMLDGEKTAKTWPGVESVVSIKEMLAAWKEQQGTLYHTHLDRGLSENCKKFDPARFEITLRCIRRLGHARESASSLTTKWKSIIRLASLGSVRQYAAKHKSPEELSMATLQQMVRYLQAEDAANSFIELLSNLAHCAWTFNTMLRWLQHEPGSQFVEWRASLESHKAEFWSALQDHIVEFLSACHVYSLKLAVFISMVISYRMFACYGQAFGDGVKQGLSGLVYKVTTRYLQEVTHREALEITRMELLHERCEFVSAEVIRKRLADNQVSAAPDENEVRGLCRLASEFHTAHDASDNPFAQASSGGLAILVEKNTETRHAMRDILGEQQHPRLVASALEVVIQLTKYEELIDAFPTAAAGIGDLLLQLVSFYVYVVVVNFTGSPDAVHGYLPEKDTSLPAATRARFDALAKAAAKLVPREANQDPAEAARPAAPLLVKSTSVRAKLASPQDLYGLVYRSAALDSTASIVRFLIQTCKRKSACLGADLLAQANQLAATLDVMTRSAIKKLSLLLCPLDTYPKVISEAKWEPKSLESEPSVYVLALLKDVRALSERWSSPELLSQLPEDLPYKLSCNVVQNIWLTLIEGYSRVKKCSNEGRAQMSLDLQTLQHSLRGIVPGSLPSAEAVEDYIRAFYMDPDDYFEWVKNNHAAYTVKQLTAWYTINTNVLDRKRKDKVEAVKRLTEVLQQLGHTDRDISDVAEVGHSGA